MTDGQPPDVPHALRDNAVTTVVFFARFYWIIAIGLFLALELLAPPGRFKVFSFILKIPFLANSPHLLNFSSLLADFLSGTLSAYFCFVALRHLGKKISFRPFWAALLVILGVAAFLRPFLTRANSPGATEIIKMILMIIALWSIYRLDWAIAFSVWALGYTVLMAPSLVMEDNPLAASAHAPAYTSVLTEFKSLNSSTHKTADQLAMRHELLAYYDDIHAAADKGDAQAQYALASIYLTGEPVHGEAPEQSLEQAFTWMSKAADQGLADAQVGLGNLYLEGAGIPISPGQAAKLYLAAAGKGNMEAEARLGWLYAHGLGVDWNGEEALKYYNDAIRGGSALGLLGAADMYMTGNGVEQNHDQAMSYYAKAAENGCAPAMVKLGLLMLAGADSPSVSAQAIQYIHQAAKAGMAEAQYLYMTIYTEGIGVAPLPGTVKWWGNHLLLSARAGHADSQWYWGLVLENGLIDHADPKQAWTWIAQSAYKGFPDALDSEGSYLAYGLAGERDTAKAAGSYQMAAQYSAEAMKTLILRYRNGAGVPRDPVKADYYADHLRLLASHGDAPAEQALGDLYRNGIFLPQSYPQALAGYQRAAENGMGESYYRLAEMTESGEGLPKNARAAFQHYRQAANLFYLPAFYNVAAGLADGIGTTKNAQESQEWVLRIERGAQRGTPAHQLSLARLRERGLFVPRDEAAAAAVYQIAALRDDVDATRALAKMYQDGRGVGKNLPLAYCWLDRAATNGDGRAKSMRDALLKKMPPRDRAQAKKLSLTFHPEDGLQK